MYFVRYRVICCHDISMVYSVSFDCHINISPALLPAAVTSHNVRTLFPFSCTTKYRPVTPPGTQFIVTVVSSGTAPAWNPHSQSWKSAKLINWWLRGTTSVTPTCTSDSLSPANYDGVLSILLITACNGLFTYSREGCLEFVNTKMTLQWTHKLLFTRVLTLVYFLHYKTNP